MSRLRLALCPTLLVFAACSTAVSGSYVLQTLNNVPFPFASDPEITAVDLRLNDDGTCNVAVTTEGVIDFTDSEETCSWTTSGTVVTVLTESDDGTAIGSLSDGRLTLTDEETGEVWVFVRR